MQRAELILQISLTLLIILAATIFAVAEEGPIPALTVPVAILTFLLVDRFQTVRLPALILNGLGLPAFLAALIEFLGDDIEARLLSGGHLLVYLTWAFLLQPKSARVIWWLTGLSLLQVAIASLLTYDNWFGLCVVPFLLVGLWTLSVFHLVRISKVVDDLGKESMETGVVSEQADVGPERLRTESWYDGAVQLDSPDRWITWRFTTTSGVGGLPVSSPGGNVFLTCPSDVDFPSAYVPRRRQGDWRCSEPDRFYRRSSFGGHRTDPGEFHPRLHVHVDGSSDRRASVVE